MKISYKIYKKSKSNLVRINFDLNICREREREERERERRVGTGADKQQKNYLTLSSLFSIRIWYQVVEPTHLCRVM